ncbi:hypothetical protein PV326_006217 [Microctonus aethiopoides]|nr:hypothetical protein PV326_006217 [Microctonus aethiopoides]
MGGSSSKATRITREILEEYAQLTYLNKAEILHIFKLFETLAPVEVAQNLHHRLPAQKILKVLPQLRYNPFSESILRVFSSNNDTLISFEDLLDLCSVMSENCPVDIKAYWAFKIFDFDNDNQLSLDDIIETVERLNGFEADGNLRIDRDSAEFVAQVTLKPATVEVQRPHTPL